MPASPEGNGKSSSPVAWPTAAPRMTQRAWALSSGLSVCASFQNEESLKKCVEDYIGRIEKEGQRYQALKAHAEEKLQL